MYLTCSMLRIQLLVPLVALLLVPTALLAGGENHPIGGRSAGMAHSSVTLTDVWSAHHNQAGLAFVDKPVVGVFSESRFLVPGLGLRGLVAAVTTNSGTFGVSLSQFGFSGYNESKVGLAYARKFGEKLSFGLQLDYLRTQIAENYGNRNMLSVELGVQAKLTNELTFGAHVYNPNRAQLADFNEERTPAIMRLGLSYRYSEKVLLAIETEKDIDVKPVFKAGLEYHITKPLYVRAGIASNPFLNAYGFGLELKQFRIDFATSYHTTLGYTPTLSLSYDFK